MFWAESIVYRHLSASFGHPKFYWISLKHWLRVNAPPTPLNWSKDLEDRESSKPLKIMARWVEPRKRDQKWPERSTINFDQVKLSKEHSVFRKLRLGHSARRVSDDNPRYGIADFEPHSNEVNLQNDTKSHPSVLLLILITLNCPKNTQFSGNYFWVTQLAGGVDTIHGMDPDSNFLVVK